MTGLQSLMTALASVLVLSGALSGQGRSMATAAHAGDEESGDPEARGRVVSASLGVIPPERWGSRGMPLELFVVSADSAFWYGPCRPHPYSWLTASVVCRDTLDFQVEVVDAAGERVDVLEFRRVPPAAYLVNLGRSVDALEGAFALNFVYDGAVIWESKFKRVSQD